MKSRLIIIAIIAVSIGLFLFFIGNRTNSVSVSMTGDGGPEKEGLPLVGGLFGSAEKPEVTAPEPVKELKLANPPEKANVLYATSWSASSKTKIDYFVNLVKNTNANALVIDIKDYSGLLAYKVDDPELAKYVSVEEKIKDPAGLVRTLHENGIYVIARVTVFQDPALATKRPDLAVKNAQTGKLWLDNKKLAWMDPASEEVWKYHVALAKDAFAKGFDEVNFDYIRFPSDGNLTVISYPFYDANAKKKSESIKEFFMYLRNSLKDEKISADLFGLTVLASDDLGIGQVIEDAFGNFDYICPMLYPSHFASGFIGYKNPASYPYEVVKHSMDEAEKKLAAWKLANPDIDPGKIRPWIQDFDLGADYGIPEVSGQIRAVTETADAGWMIWSPKNIYTSGAFTDR